MVAIILKMQIDKIIYSNPYQIVVKSAGNYYGIHPNNDATKAKFKYDNKY